MQGKLKGDPKELVPFLNDLESIDRSPAQDPEGRDDDFALRLDAVTELFRAWFKYGPYHDGSGIEFRVLKLRGGSR